MKGTTRNIVVGIGLLVIGSLAIYFGATELIHCRQIAARGKTTTGRILETEDRMSGRLFRHTYYLQVQFQPEMGGLITQHIEVSDAVFQASQASPEVKVHYLPEDPTLCQAGDGVEMRYSNLLWGLVFAIAGGYMLVFFRQPADQDATVETINEHVKTLCITHFEYVSVDAKKFKHLDLDFYDTGRRHLETQGYRFQDDQENVTLRKRGGSHTFLRYLLSRDQTTMAIFYHFLPPWTVRVLGAKPSKVLDLETWFSDGCFVCTSNAEMAGKLESPPTMDTLCLPAGTALDLLLQAHQNRIAKYLANHPGAKPVQLQDMADIRRAQDEQQRIKAEFRRRTGVTKGELERLGGTSGKSVDELHDALTKRRERGE